MLCCIMRWADTSSLLVVVSQNWILLDKGTGSGKRHAEDRWRRYLENSKAGKVALKTNKKVVDAAYYEMMARH